MPQRRYGKTGRVWIIVLHTLKKIQKTCSVFLHGEKRFSKSLKESQQKEVKNELEEYNEEMKECKIKK